jgi:hypothetical protein
MRGIMGEVDLDLGGWEIAMPVNSGRRPAEVE